MKITTNYNPCSLNFRYLDQPDPHFSWSPEFKVTLVEMTTRDAAVPYPLIVSQQGKNPQPSGMLKPKKNSHSKGSGCFLM